ncbi:MAG: aminotransferase [Bacteroidia bacterium]|nr:MAG: aminotransferase [Bacteroidia bacterium]
MSETATKLHLPVSHMAENLIGSEIIKLAGEVNAKIKAGEKIYNFTIGDFNPKIFPIPAELKQAIIDAYLNDETNYPAADGMQDLRDAVAAFIKRMQHLDYKSNEILIAGGARPVIYAIYKAIIDPGDGVLFPVPSWNNNHYCHLSGANPICVETKPENNFMPIADEIKPHISNTVLLALCSPLNPTGTTFTEKALREICELVIAENKRRGEKQKPVYFLYDQIYSALTYGNIKHLDPVSLYPELKNYTIFVDGISKSFAATGVRVGWTFGPQRIIDKMKAILSHVGAWAPKAEQMATAKFLNQEEVSNNCLVEFKKQISMRLDGFYKGFQTLKNEGFKVDAIAPQAAIYLTIQFDLKGKKTTEGKVLETTADVTKYILDEAKMAVVPFYAFGASHDSTWFRLSVGTAKIEDIEGSINNLRYALQKLN